MKNRTLLPLLLNALVLAFTPAAFADDDKDESGKGRYRAKERKEEFWDGNCKVERKWEKNGEYKEERKCGGDGGRSASRKEEFDDGNCKVERKWKAGRRCAGKPDWQGKRARCRDHRRGGGRCSDRRRGRQAPGCQ